MQTVKRTTKRALSLFLAVVMISTMFFIFDMGDLRADATVSQADVPAITFYVPETVYLEPSTGNMNKFQYFVDNNTDGSVNRQAEKTTGIVYFDCAGATNVSISLSGVTSFTALTGTNTVNTTISNGYYLSTALAQSTATTDSGAVLTWTATYTLNGKTYTAYNYTYAYAPLCNVSSTAATSVMSYYWKSAQSDPFICISTWLTGVHSAAILSNPEVDGSTQNSATGSFISPPLVNNTVQGRNIDLNVWNSGTKDWVSVVSGGNGAYSYLSTDEIDVSALSATADIWVDTSRYTNYNQIPNLQTGFDHHGCRSNNTAYYHMKMYDGVGYDWHRKGYSDEDRSILVNGTDIIPKTMYSGLPSGDNHGTVSAFRSKFKISRDIRSNGEMLTFVSLGKVFYKNNERSVAAVTLKTNTINKGTLRSVYNAEIKKGIQGVSYNSTNYSSYQSALSNAAKVLGNPKTTQTAIDNAVTAINASATTLGTSVKGTATANHLTTTAGNAAIATAETLSYVKGNNVTGSANTYAGYTYAGYHTNSAGGGNISATSSTLYRMTDNSCSWTFYYNPNTYYIKYNGNGNTGGSMSSNSTHYYDISSNLTANAFTKNGYSFGGWSKNIASSTVWKANSAALFKETNSSGVAVNQGDIINVYAIWIPKDFTVTFNYDPAGAGHIPFMSGNSQTSKSVKFDTTYGTNGSLPTPTMTGWSFDGWYTGYNTGTKAYTGPVANNTLYNPNPESGTTLYAKWTCLFDGGHGSAADPFLIGSFDSFDKIDSNSPTYSYVAKNSYTDMTNVQRGLYFKQTADVVVTGAGTINTPVLFFYGADYDGNNKKITLPTTVTLDDGMSSIDGRNEMRSGIFGGVFESTIKNLSVSIEGKLLAVGDASMQAHAAFAGVVSRSDLTNITVTLGANASIKASSPLGASAGALAAQFTDGGSLNNCIVILNGGEITSDSAVAGSGIDVRYFVGALWSGGAGNPTPEINIWWTFVIKKPTGVAQVNTDTTTYNNFATVNGETILRGNRYCGTYYLQDGSGFNPGGTAINGQLSVARSGEIVFTATPNTGYFTEIRELNENVRTNGLNRSGSLLQEGTTVGQIISRTEGHSDPYDDTEINGNFDGIWRVHSVWFTQKLTLATGSNGSIDNAGDYKMTQGEKKTSTATPNAGYDFDKWVITGSGTIPAGDVTNPVLNYTMGNTASTVTATFKPKIYVVTWNANGGTPATQTTNQTFNANIVLPANAVTSAGYEFAGWFTAQTGGTQITAAVKYETVGTSTYWAHWNKNTYKLVFNANTGTGTAPAAHSNLNYDTTIPALNENTFTKDYHYFVLWNSKADGNGYTRFDKNSAVVSLIVNDQGKQNVSSDIYLYAIWDTIKYTVSYTGNGSNGGTAPAAVSNKIYTDSFAAAANTFTKTGYYFDKWTTGSTAYATGASASVQQIAADQNKKISTTSAVALDLSASWLPNNYSIQYDGNVIASGTVAGSTTLKYDSTLTLAGLATFTSAGYTLTGWNTAANGSGTAYGLNAANVSVSAIATAQGKQNTNSSANVMLTLYAQWSPNSYVLTYNGNSGTVSNGTRGASTTRSHVYNAVMGGFSAGVAPQRAGYFLDKWQVGASATYIATNLFKSNLASGFITEAGVTGTPGDSGSSAGALVSVNIPVTAATKYFFSGMESASYYILAYNSSNGFLGKMAATGDGGSFTAPANTAYVKIVFPYGLSDALKSYLVLEAETGTYGSFFGAAANNTTAQWTPIQYNVIYNGNTSTGGAAPANATFTYNATEAIAGKNTLVKTGYYFNGWNTAANGTGTALAVGNRTSNLSTIPGSNVTLYAQWLPNNYSLQYNGNQAGGTVAGPTNLTYTSTIPSLNGATTFTYTGYTLTGWTSASNGSGTVYTPGQANVAVSTLATEQSKQSTDSSTNVMLTLYAKWSANTYKIDWNTNTGKYLDDSTVKQTNVVYNTNYVLPEQPTKIGYTFKGWYTATSGGTPITASVSATSATLSAASLSNPATATTFYAQWNAVMYTLSFDYHGGTGTPASLTNQTYATSFTFPTPDARTGYTFDKWYTSWTGDVYSGTSYAAGATGTVPANNQTYHAKWLLNKYTITFDYHGGSGTPESIPNIDYSSTFTFPTPTAKTGYTFDKWYTNWTSAGDVYSGTSYAAGATGTVPANNQTYHAKWIVNQYNVYFNANVTPADLTGAAPSTISANYGTGATVPGANTMVVDKTGVYRIFMGWNTKADGTGTQYAAGSNITVGYNDGKTATPAGNTTLYAQWSGNYYDLRARIDYLSNPYTNYEANSNDPDYMIDGIYSMTSANGDGTYVQDMFTQETRNPLNNTMLTAYNKMISNPTKDQISIDSDLSTVEYYYSNIVLKSFMQDLIMYPCTEGECDNPDHPKIHSFEDLYAMYYNTIDLYEYYDNYGVFYEKYQILMAQIGLEESLGLQMPETIKAPHQEYLSPFITEFVNAYHLLELSPADWSEFEYLANLAEMDTNSVVPPYKNFSYMPYDKINLFTTESYGFALSMIEAGFADYYREPPLTKFEQDIVNAHVANLRAAIDALVYKNVNYYIDLYMQKLDSSFPLSYTEREVRSDKSVGSTVNNILPPSKTGFVFNNGYANNVLVIPSLTVEPSGQEGTINVLKYYYLRKQFTITYNSEGGSAIPTAVVKYNESYAIPIPEKTGYVFDGWYKELSYATKFEIPGATMPDLSPGVNNVNTSISLYAKWIPKPNVDYKIELYYMDLDGDYSSTPSTVKVKQAPTNTVIDLYSTEAYLEYVNPGYAFDEWAWDNEVEGTVAPDGSLVLKLYYLREIYNFVYNSDIGTVPNSTEAMFGSTVTLETMVDDADEFEFLGWYLDTGFTSKPVITNIPDMGNNGDEIQLYAKWGLNYLPLIEAFDEFGGFDNRAFPVKDRYGVTQQIVYTYNQEIFNQYLELCDEINTVLEERAFSLSQMDVIYDYIARLYMMVNITLSENKTLTQANYFEELSNEYDAMNTNVNHMKYVDGYSPEEILESIDGVIISGEGLARRSVDEAQNNMNLHTTSLYSEMQNIQEYIDDAQPNVKVYDVKSDSTGRVDDIDGYVADREEVSEEIDTDDYDSITYVYPGKDHYTYRCYTNDLNPIIMLDITDVPDSDGRVSYPAHDDIATKVNNSTLVTEGMTEVIGSAPSSARADGNDERYSCIALTPEFTDGYNNSQTITYTISLTDDALNPNEPEFRSIVGAVDTKQMPYGVTNSGSTEAQAVTPLGTITVYIEYRNSMTPDEDGNHVLDDGSSPLSLHTEITTPNAPDTWTNKVTMSRTPGGIPLIDYFVAKGDGVYKFNDPTFGKKDLGSFIYFLDDANPGDTAIIDKFVAGDEEGAKSDIINAINDGQRDSLLIAWAKSTTFLNSTRKTNYNRTLVFAHMADRWGNVCNQLMRFGNIDAKTPTSVTPQKGILNVTETGGSGVKKIDIYKYSLGGSPQYLGANGIKFDYSGSQQIIDNALNSTDNMFEVTLGQGADGGRYTALITDYAGNQTTRDFFVDAAGKIRFTIVDPDNMAGKTGASTGNEYSFSMNGTYTINLFAEVSGAKEVVIPEGVKVNTYAKIKVITTTDTDKVKVRDIVSQQVWYFESVTTGVTIEETENGYLEWTVPIYMSKVECTLEFTARQYGVWDDTAIEKEIICDMSLNPLRKVTGDTAAIKTNAYITIIAIDEVDMIKMTDASTGVSKQYAKTNIGITLTSNGDGTSTWSIPYKSAKAGEFTFNMTARCGSVWEESSVPVTLIFV